MAKTLLYRVFGIGKIPDQVMVTLRSEGILALDEGIKGSVTYRDFHAPGKYPRGGVNGLLRASS